MKDDMYKLSEGKDIVNVYSEVYTSTDTDKALERIPENVRPDFLNHIFSAQFWKRVEDTHIPLEIPTFFVSIFLKSNYPCRRGI